MFLLTVIYGTKVGNVLSGKVKWNKDNESIRLVSQG